MTINYRKMPDGSVAAPKRGKAPPCPAGFVRDSGDAFRFHPVRGFGDTVASLIDRFTKIKPCAACERRKKFLNRILPYESVALYQELYDTSDYGQEAKDRCPGVRYLEHYIDHLKGKVIDLGCGTGDTVRALRAKGLAADGIDQIDLKNGMSVGSITNNLNLEDYTSAICIDVLEHLYDDQVDALLKNLKQVQYQAVTVHTSTSWEQGYPFDLHVNIKNTWLEHISKELVIVETITLAPNRILYLCERRGDE